MSRTSSRQRAPRMASGESVSGELFTPHGGSFTDDPSIKYEFSGLEEQLIATPYTSLEVLGVAASESKERLAPPGSSGRDTARFRTKSLFTVVPTTLEPTSKIGGEPTTRTVSRPATSRSSSTFSRSFK